MRPSKLYPFSIPASGSVTLLVEGDFFKVKSSTGMLSVTGDSFGTLEDLLAGQGLRDTNFKRLTLTDETGAVNNGFILVSDSTFIDDRITGEVSVIDGGKSRTLANTAFWGNVSMGSAVGALSTAQIFNPAGSGKNLVIEQILGSANAATNLSLNYHDTQLTTLTGNALSKKRGGAASVAQMREELPVAAVGTRIAVFGVAATSAFFLTLREPIVLPPATGLVMYSAATNVPIIFGVEFYEDPV